ncbi:MAG: helix-hairpin-helix domain-containing protein [Parafannyhessea sp.]|uniref:ComEA family DNA-binding protein n=1 Tax=Parafannyhessea sp. TaxID=2847324 RepID=UPI003F08F357
MAQTGARRTGRAGGGGLPRRYGLEGKRGVVVAAVVLVAALCAIGAVALPRVGGDGSFEVERDASAVSASKASAGKGSSDAKADVGDSGSSGDATAGKSVTSSTSRAGAARSVVVVHVDGAVRAPGVYELHSSKPRVDDAVRAAGGLAEDADTTSINLASVVSDGQKIHVPAEGEEVAADEGGATTGGSSAGDASGTGGATGTQSQDAGKVNINTADETQLQQLPGVGEATAKAIVEDRQNNGAFSTPEDLMRVSGIGEKKFERMRSMVCV